MQYKKLPFKLLHQLLSLVPFETLLSSIFLSHSTAWTIEPLVTPKINKITYTVINPFHLNLHCPKFVPCSRSQKLAGGLFTIGI